MPQRGHSRRSNAPDTQALSNTDDPDPEHKIWDTSEASLGPFVYSLEFELDNEDENFANLIENGTITTKGKITTLSVEHTEIIKQDLMPEYSFLNPSPLIPVGTGAIQPPTKVIKVPAPPTPGGTPSGGTPAPTTVNKTVPRAELTSEDEKIFFVGAVAIRTKDRALCTFILGRISDAGTRQELKEECKNSGRQLITNLLAKVKSISDASACAIEAHMALLLSLIHI